MAKTRIESRNDQSISKVPAFLAGLSVGVGRKGDIVQKYMGINLVQR